MSFTAAQDIKEQVRQATDVVDLVGSYIESRREGRGYKGLCPWHDDSKPSLQVNPERQIWRCFVCDVGGDVFSFVMKREGIEFREALTMLAERAGIALPTTRRQVTARPGSPDDKNTLYQAMAWAEKQYHSCLLQAPEAAPARRYLEQRKITRESVDRYHLGFAPNQWQWLLDRSRTSSFSPAVLQAVGLVGSSQRTSTLYDRFKGRVLFPIRDVQHRPIALGGRILPEFADDKAAKYINSPETQLFSKSEQLYGLDVVRDAISKSRQVAVMEGYTDVVMARQFDLDNVVAVLGTALGVKHVQLLKRYADTITLVLDGDEAGQRRTNEVLELFIASQVNLRIVTLPQGLDPCDFLQQNGADAFRRLLGNAVDALDHKIDSLTRGLDLASDTHRANEALEEILATVAKAPRLLAGTERSVLLRKDQFLARLAREFQVDEAQLRDRLRDLRKKPTGSRTARGIPAATTLSTLDSLEQELLEVILQQPEAIARVAESVAVEELPSPAARQLYEICCRLAQGREAVDFQRLMNELEDAELRNLLVLLDGRSREKPAGEPELRLQDLLAAFERRRCDRQCRQKAAALNQSGLNEAKELDLLKEIIDQQRSRQGISAPTDG